LNRDGTLHFKARPEVGQTPNYRRSEFGSRYRTARQHIQWYSPETSRDRKTDADVDLYSAQLVEQLMHYIRP
jgi:hypothetical protein